MKSFALLAIALALTGCDQCRNSLDEQIEDYKACVAAGMKGVYTSWGEIQCRPYRGDELNETYPDGKPCLGDVSCQDFSKRRRAIEQENKK